MSTFTVYRPRLKWRAGRRAWVGLGYAIEWRVKLKVWDAFRFQDSPAPAWNRRAVMATTPTLRTRDFFEACCFVLGTRQFGHRSEL